MNLKSFRSFLAASFLFSRLTPAIFWASEERKSSKEGKSSEPAKWEEMKAEWEKNREKEMKFLDDKEERLERVKGRLLEQIQNFERERKERAEALNQWDKEISQGADHRLHSDGLVDGARR